MRTVPLLNWRCNGSFATQEVPHRQALHIASQPSSSSQPRAAEIEALELDDFIRLGFQLVGTARRAATRIGDCPGVWGLLEAAADAERALLLLEATLEEDHA